MLQVRNKTSITTTQFPGKPAVPSAIKKEHSKLLNQIQPFTLYQDSSGLAAKKLFDLMQHNFSEEEDFVLPQLGLLPLLAGGKLPGPINEVIQLTGKLKENLPHLDAEHQFIKAYIAEWKQVAAKEQLPAINDFENAIQIHANAEEEVFFPAAVLVGEYLKLKASGK